MAEARVIPVPRVQIAQRVVLNLSLDEANVIYDIAYRRVAGSVDDSRRGLINEISTALWDAGVTGEGSFDMSPELIRFAAR